MPHHPHHSFLQQPLLNPSRDLADRVSRLFADVDRQMALQNAAYVAAGGVPSAVVTPHGPLSPITPLTGALRA